MNNSELRDILLSTEYIIDNEYLEKYIDLIINNLPRSRVKYETEKHHIIPRCLCKLIGYENIDYIDNFKNFVNLQYKDHIIAHIFLVYCSTGKFYSNMCSTVYRMFGNTKHPSLKDRELIFNESEFELITHAKALHHAEMSRINTGKRLINNGSEQRYVYADENIDDYLNNGWKIGIASTYVTISKDEKIKHVNIDQLNTYLDNGWIKGTSDSIKAKHRNLVTIHNETEERHVNIDIVQNYLNAGWSLGRSESFKEINSRNKLGEITISKNDTVKRISKDALSSYLLDGWSIGKPKNCKKISIVKDDVEIKVSSDDLDYYLNELGYKKGYSSKHLEKLKNIHKGQPAWNKGISPSEETRIKRLRTISEKYPNGIHFTQSAEIREKIGASKRNKVSISKNGVIKYINSNDLQSFLDVGWSKGRKG